MKRIFYFLAILAVSCDKPVSVTPVAAAKFNVTFSDISASGSLTNYTLNASYTKSTTSTAPIVALEQGFIFGTGSDLANGSRIQATGTGQTISVSPKGIVYDKTYYYRPYVTINGNEFAGAIQSFTTQKITAATMSPVVAGRGQKVTIQGDFLTNDKKDVGVFLDASSAVITSFSRNKLEFMIPESAGMDKTYSVSVMVADAGVAVQEKLKISHWSIMTPVSQDFFKSLYPNRQSAADFFLNGTQSFFNGSAVFTYDRGTDTWSNGAGLAGTPAAAVISDPTFFTLSGKGYLTMGSVSSTTTVYELDASGTQWQSIGTSPAVPATYNGVFTSNEAYGKYGYYGLGLDAGQNPIRSLWRFSADNTWLQSSSPYPGKPISYGVAFVISDFILVGGGLDFSTNPPGINRDFYSYTFSGGNIWVKRADFPDIEVTRGFVFDDKGYALGVDGSIWVYEFAGSWQKSSEKIPNTTTRYNPRVWISGDHIFIAGGTTANGTQLNDSYRWDPRP